MAVMSGCSNKMSIFQMKLQNKVICFVKTQKPVAYEAVAGLAGTIGSESNLDMASLLSYHVSTSVPMLPHQFNYLSSFSLLTLLGVLLRQHDFILDHLHGPQSSLSALVLHAFNTFWHCFKNLHLQRRLVDILCDDPAILCLVAESQAELGELAVFMSPEILVMPPHVQNYLALWVPVGDQAVGNVFLRLLDILRAHLEVERAVRRNGALLKIL